MPAIFFTKPPWNLDYFDIDAFESFLVSLDAVPAAVVYEKVTQVLATYGTDLINRGLVKPLGAGLYEYRIRENPDVLVRVFFEIASGRTILILHFYDKKANSSSNFQQSQIKNRTKKAEIQTLNLINKIHKMFSRRS